MAVWVVATDTWGPHYSAARANRPRPPRARSPRPLSQVYGKAIVALENPDGDTNAPPAPGGTYQGDWFHGERSGRGRFVFPDLSKFKTLTCTY